MAFVIPAVAAFAAAGGTIAGVGAALTGAAGFATFATVAGGFMASAGMLTKNKTLTKVGSILGIAGAVTGLASSLSSAASGAADGALQGAADDALANSAGDKLAKDAMTESLKSEMANSAVGETIGQFGASGAGSAGSTLSQAGQVAGGPGAPLTLSQDPYLQALDQPGQNLMEQARLARAAPTQSAQLAGQGGDLSQGMASVGAGPTGTGSGVSPRLVEAGQAIKDKTALDTILDKINGVGKWVKDNKELAQVGGQMLAGGMQAYQQGQQFDTQMSLLAQRRARLNQPVVLGIQPPQLNTYRTGG